MNGSGDNALHLDSGDVAAYHDGALTPAERARVEAHLAECADCRGEVVAVARLLRAAAPRRRWYVPAGIAAAAALALLLAPWRSPPAPPGEPVLREPAVTTTAAPIPIAPLGAVAVAPALTWSSVPHADRYRLTVFDRDGSIVWQTEATDTMVALPAGVRIAAGTPYFWKVAARTGWDRWVASDLATFTLDAARPPR